MHGPIQICRLAVKYLVSAQLATRRRLIDRKARAWSSREYTIQGT